MRSCGENVTAKEVNEMVKFADKDGDGKIDFEEFKNARLAKEREE